MIKQYISSVNLPVQSPVCMVQKDINEANFDSLLSLGGFAVVVTIFASEVFQKEREGVV